MPVAAQKLPKVPKPQPEPAPFVTPHQAVFAEPRLYEHVLIADEEECQRAVETGFNCSQTLELCPTGKALLMVTDIINPATYAQREGTVRVDLAEGREPGLAESLVFTAAEDADVLVDEYGNEWTRSTPSWSMCN